jgi:hypothetical protein
MGEPNGRGGAIFTWCAPLHAIIPNNLGLLPRGSAGAWFCVGDRTEILIDRAEVPISHVSVDGPGHDLQQRSGRVWIFARTDDLLVFPERPG